MRKSVILGAKNFFAPLPYAAAQGSKFFLQTL